MTTDLSALATIADYQFGSGAGAALFDGEVTIRRGSTGRPQQILADGERLVSYGIDGRFTLGVAGGRRLQAALDPPAYRVVVGEESEPYVAEGRNAFAKFVRAVDPAVRPGDEVLVELEDDTLLAVGRAELSAEGMRDFDSGMAVKVRDAIAD
ncbi:MAG: pseudouridine synthase [Natronomonas sp.]